jgi:hypothetical protein
MVVSAHAQVGDPNGVAAARDPMDGPLGQARTVAPDDRSMMVNRPAGGVGRRAESRGEGDE